MDDSFLAIPIIAILFLGLPWVILHYITRWKTAATLTGDDENMLDQMFETARRLEERLATVERIIVAENPDFRPGALQAPRPSPETDFDRRN